MWLSVANRNVRRKLPGNINWLQYTATTSFRHSISIRNHDNALTRSDLALTGLLFVVGIFGIAFAANYYERTKANADRYYAYRNKLDQLFFDSSVLTAALDEAAQVTKAELPRLARGGSLSWIKPHRLWITFHAIIAILGLVLTALILYKTL